MDSGRTTQLSAAFLNFLNGAFLSDPYKLEVFNFRGPWFSRYRVEKDAGQVKQRDRALFHYIYFLPRCRTLVVTLLAIGELLLVLDPITPVDYCPWQSFLQVRDIRFL